MYIACTVLPASLSVLIQGHVDMLGESKLLYIAMAIVKEQASWRNLFALGLLLLCVLYFCKGVPRLVKT